MFTVQGIDHECTLYREETMNVHCTFRRAKDKTLMET